MINKVFGVYDSKSLAYLQPFFSESTGAAVRAFSDAVNDNSCPIAKHPGDYQLYELGSFNNSNGEFVSLSPTRLLGNGLDFVNNLGKVFPGVSLNPESVMVKEGVSNGS